MEELVPGDMAELTLEEQLDYYKKAKETLE
jgi:hypothetical protein